MAEHEDPGRLPQTRLYFREWRERAGISQERVAELMGVSGATVHKHEAGKTKGASVAYLRSFALAVGCNPWDPIAGPPGILPQIGTLLLELNPDDLQLILGIVELLRRRYT